MDGAVTAPSRAALAEECLARAESPCRFYASGEAEVQFYRDLAAALLREPLEYVGGNCRVCGKHDGQHAPAPTDEEVARHLETRFCNGFGIEDVATRIHVVRSVRGATVRAKDETHPHGQPGYAVRSYCPCSDCVMARRVTADEGYALDAATLLAAADHPCEDWPGYYGRHPFHKEAP